jgi:hypothetical protein
MTYEYDFILLDHIIVGRDEAMKMAIGALENGYLKEPRLNH